MTAPREEPRARLQTRDSHRNVTNPAVPVTDTPGPASAGGDHRLGAGHGGRRRHPWGCPRRNRFASDERGDRGRRREGSCARRFWSSGEGTTGSVALVTSATSSAAAARPRRTRSSRDNPSSIVRWSTAHSTWSRSSPGVQPSRSRPTSAAVTTTRWVSMRRRSACASRCHVPSSWRSSSLRLRTSARAVSPSVARARRGRRSGPRTGPRASSCHDPRACAVFNAPVGDQVDTGRDSRGAPTCRRCSSATARSAGCRSRNRLRWPGAS